MSDSRCLVHHQCWRMWADPHCESPCESHDLGWFGARWFGGSGRGSHLPSTRTRPNVSFAAREGTLCKSHNRLPCWVSQVRHFLRDAFWGLFWRGTFSSQTGAGPRPIRHTHTADRGLLGEVPFRVLRVGHSGGAFGTQFLQSLKRQGAILRVTPI